MLELNVGRLTHLLTQAVLTSSQKINRPLPQAVLTRAILTKTPRIPPVFPDDAVAILSIDPHFPSQV